MCMCGSGIPVESREGLGSSTAGVLGICEMPWCGRWELTLGPLQEQCALLKAEPSLEYRDLFLVAYCPVTSGLQACRLGHMTQKSPSSSWEHKTFGDSICSSKPKGIELKDKFFPFRVWVLLSTMALPPIWGSLSRFGASLLHHSFLSVSL